MRRESVRVNPEVDSALGKGSAVVALETTIISHGMPYPTNIETAMAVEEIIRSAGAVPATIGIVEGEITVGLTQEELRFFATGTEIVKAGEREIPLVVARRLNAATTAGSSLAIAAAVGVSVFVTGGIGAVGPAGTTTFDISADLLALAKYPCMTVCAGAKAFMDIAATLEFLETHGVPVVVYQSQYFPLFYSRSSGHRVEWVGQDVDEIAGFFATKRALDIGGGILVGVPIPEEEELPEETLRTAIEAALARIKDTDVTGKEVTPFILSAIKEATGGKSLEANVALVKNNARIGAQIAVALSARMG